MSTTILIEAEATLDLSHHKTDRPLLVLKHALEALDNGKVLRLICRCSAFEDDLLSWCRHTGNSVLGVETLDVGEHAYYVRKGDPWPVAARLDARGTGCPIPVIRTAKYMNKMEPGSSVKLISDCPTAPVEVESWVKATGHDLLGMFREMNGVYQFYIRKGQVTRAA